MQKGRKKQSKYPFGEEERKKKKEDNEKQELEFSKGFRQIKNTWVFSLQIYSKF